MWTFRTRVSMPFCKIIVKALHCVLIVTNLLARVDSIDKLRNKLAIVEAETSKDPTKFRDLYVFSFAYAKNPTQKGIELDMAIPYWHILLHGRFPLLNLWTQFLTVSD